MEIIDFNTNRDISEIKEKLQVSPFIHPTNSCYGIGGSIYSKECYRRIYELKGRDKTKPFFITIPDISFLDQIGKEDIRIHDFLEAYPNKIFTFILQRHENLPDYINTNIDTVGVQIATGVLGELFKFIDFPVFGTSANISGQDPLYDFSEVCNTFGEYKDIIFFDGGKLEISSPSTIIDLTGEEYKVLRGTLL